MCDGAVFSQLVDVIEGTEHDVCSYHESLSTREMEANINFVLEFLSNNNVSVQHIVPQDILEGKLSAVKQLVLLLASHFKSDTFNQSFSDDTGGTSNNKLKKTSSLVSLLSNAAATLAEASRNASGKFKYKGSHNHISLRSRSRGNCSASSTSLEMDNHDTPPKRRSVQEEEIPMSTNSVSCLRTLFTSLNNSLSVPKSSRIKNKHTVQSVPKNIPATDESYTGVGASPSIESSKSAFKQETCVAGTPVTTSDFNSAISSKVDVTPKKTIAKYYSTESLVNNELYDCHTTDRQEIISHIPAQEKVREDGYFELLNHHKEILDDLGIAKTFLLELQNLLGDGKTAKEESSDFMLDLNDQACTQLKPEINEPRQYVMSNKSKEKYDDMTENEEELQELRCQLSARDDIIQKQKLQISELNAEVQRKSELEASLQSKLDMQESKVRTLQKQLQELTERMHSIEISGKGREKTYAGVITGKLNKAKFYRDAQKIRREHKNMCTTLYDIRQLIEDEDRVQQAFDCIEQNMTSFVKALSEMETSMQTEDNNNNHKVMTRSKSCLPLYSYNSGYRNSSSSDSVECLNVICYAGKSTTPVLKIYLI